MAKNKRPSSSPSRSVARSRPAVAGKRPEQNQAGFQLLLFINNPQPMWVYDAKTLRFLDVNAAAISHYGYSRDEFLRMRIVDIRPQEDVARLLEDCAQAKAGLRRTVDWRHLRKDSSLIDVEVAAHSLSFAETEAVLVVVRDITQHKRAEEALRQAEQKYRGMVEDAVVGIFQSTPGGRYLTANPAMARMFGYGSPQELVESITDIGQQVYVNAKDREEFRRLLEQFGEVQNFECQIYRKDGSKMWISANARAIREQGSVVRFEGMNEDITRRKLLEEQLLQSQKMEAVGLLAGGVAHDFNNALSVITGYSGLLEVELAADHPLRRYTQEITKAAHRASALIRQLLAFSRKQLIQPVILDLNPVVVETEKMLRRLIGEDIEIIITRDPSPARVKADPGQLEQILMNLAVNARDAMPRGGKLIIKTANMELDEVYTRQHLNFEAGRYVALSFSDTGCGMDRETQARIFEPFFTTKAPGKGTGLGLSTVYGIVTQNRGHVRVYSEPGKGTTFTIYLPQAQAASQPSNVAEVSPDLPRGSETILLVEDEPALRKLARDCLESNGYSVLEAADGQAALTAAAEHPASIQLLLTDVIMPGLNGHDLASRMAELRPEIKVLYMSGYANDLIAQYGVLHPDTLLLEKPFTLSALLTKVRQALHTSQKAKAASAP